MSFSGEAQSLVTRILSALVGVMIKSSMKIELQKDLLDIKNYPEQNSSYTITLFRNHPNAT